MDQAEKSRRLKTYLERIAPGSFDRGSDNYAGFESLSQSTLEIPGNPNTDISRAMEQLASGQTLKSSIIADVEAIVHTTHRPAVFISHGQFNRPPAPWQHLSEDGIRQRLENAIMSIGRIELPGLVSIPFGGTGFVVGQDLIMTNRHVAEIFASGIGIEKLQFKRDATAAFNPLREHQGEFSDTDNLQIVDIVMIHPFWDMALLRVSGIDKRCPALTLGATPIEDYIGNDIAVIGYPAQDHRNDLELQNRIFNNVYGVKRLQPGKIDPKLAVKSFDNNVEAATHDASTLGGNSGSAVVDVLTGKVLALHFAGKYLEANFAVPSSELARDSRVVAAGVKFDKTVAMTHNWSRPWNMADLDPAVSKAADSMASMSTTVPANDSPMTAQATVNNSAQSVSITIPLTVTVTVGSPLTGSADINIALNNGAHAMPPAVTQTEGMLGRSKPDASVLDKAYESAAASALGDSGRSLPAAITTAAASTLVYSDNAQHIEHILTNKLQFNSAMFSTIDGTEFAVASNDTTVLVSFRGTQGVADWIGNMKIHSTVSTYGSVHYGFYKAFQVARYSLEQQLEAQGAESKTVIITGHSLGGAVATIAASEWRDTYSIGKLVTFGQPAVGKRDFVESMSEFSSRYFRYINGDDLVSRIPPNYRHTGVTVAVPDKSEQHTESLTNLDDASDPNEATMSEPEFRMVQQMMSSSAQAPNGEALFSGIADHSMVRYLEQLLRLLPA